jgi:hypothetical protein
MELTRRPWRSKRASTSGPATPTTSWRLLIPASSRSARSRASSGPPTRGRATVTSSRQASRRAVREWWDTPRWRARGSAKEARRQAMAWPPRATAASRTGPTSSAVVPSRVAVPTTPGPMATTAASAPARWRATARAESTVTASRSPPKACPAVIVTSIKLRSRSVATKSERARGRLAPSVMT